MELMTKHGAIVSKSVIRLKDGCCARFTNNGFTMSVFTFSKSIECFLHAYYRVFSLNIFLISMVKSGGYIWLSRISTSFVISVKINVQVLSKLSDRKTIFHWQP